MYWSYWDGVLTGQAIKVAILGLVVWLHGIRAVVVSGLPAHMIQELRGRREEGGEGGREGGREGRKVVDRCLKTREFVGFFW